MAATLNKQRINAISASGLDVHTAGDQSARGKIRGNGAARRNLPMSWILRRMADKVQHERVRTNTKQSTRPHNAKFSDDQVRALRRARTAGAAIKDLAAIVGMDYLPMSRILDGTNYSKVL